MSDIKTLYTAHVHVTGGREGAARSSDGRLDLKLAVPGSPGARTNPEQLFVAGWSACLRRDGDRRQGQGRAHRPGGVVYARDDIWRTMEVRRIPKQVIRFIARGFEISPVLLSGHRPAARRTRSIPI